MTQAEVLVVSFKESSTEVTQAIPLQVLPVSTAVTPKHSSAQNFLLNMAVSVLSPGCYPSPPPSPRPPPCSLGVSLPLADVTPHPFLPYFPLSTYHHLTLHILLIYFICYSPLTLPRMYILRGQGFFVVLLTSVSQIRTVLG